MDIRAAVAEGSERLRRRLSSDDPDAVDDTDDDTEQHESSRSLRLAALRPSLRAPEMGLLTRTITAKHALGLEYVNLYGSLRDDPDVMFSGSSSSSSSSCCFVDAVLSPEHCPNLKVLNLGWNGLEDRHAARIGRALRKASKTTTSPSPLRSLLLGRNLIGDRGAAALADGGLRCDGKKQSSLVELNLSGNKIGPVGCRSISSAIAKQKKSGGAGGAHCIGLMVLSLGNNTVGDEGAAALAEALGSGSSCSLLVLGLEGNGIGPGGCGALAAALARNSTLCVLHLWRNPVAAAGLAALEASLRYANYSLENLVVCCDWYANDNEDGNAWANAAADKDDTDLQDRLRRLCAGNRRAKRAFDHMIDDHPRIPLGLWPQTLEIFEQKPSLIYEVLTAKPDLWDL